MTPAEAAPGAALALPAVSPLPEVSALGGTSSLAGSAVSPGEPRATSLAGISKAFRSSSAGSGASTPTSSTRIVSWLDITMTCSLTVSEASWGCTASVSMVSPGKEAAEGRGAGSGFPHVFAPGWKEAPAGRRGGLAGPARRGRLFGCGCLGVLGRRTRCTLQGRRDTLVSAANAPSAFVAPLRSRSRTEGATLEFRAAGPGLLSAAPFSGNEVPGVKRTNTQWQFTSDNSISFRGYRWGK